MSTLNSILFLGITGYVIYTISQESVSSMYRKTLFIGMMIFVIIAFTAMLFGNSNNKNASNMIGSGDTKIQHIYNKNY